MTEQKRCDKLVSVYVDVDPTTKKIFYVGIGVPGRISHRVRNRYHREYVKKLFNNEFIRKIIHKNIPAHRAWEIEKQIIRKCGRIFNNTGYLTNIHDGGPLPFEDETGYHWLKGKKKKDILPYYKSYGGISYAEQYGEERARDIIERQKHSRANTVTRRIEKDGTKVTPKQRAAMRELSQRRKRREYTEKEIAFHKRISERQLGKTMRERLGDPNWVSPKTGKTIQEICKNPDYVNPNKGKTAKQIHGEDYIDPRAVSFFIQINNETPILCVGDRDFREKFNAHDGLLYKLKEHKCYTIKRLKNTRHSFPDKSIVKYIPAI